MSYKYLLSFLIGVSCIFLKERLAIKRCRFTLESVRGYDFAFASLKLDFNIKGENPNDVDAVIDRITYAFFVNDKDVFSGTTAKKVRIKAKKSTRFTTTITLEYQKIGSVILEAIKTKEARYRLKGKAYISTVFGEISYPVTLSL